MTVQYQIVSGTDFSSATIVIEGETYPYTSKMPNWEALVLALANGEQSEEKLLTLINPARGLRIKFQRLSDRLVFRKGKVYFDNDLVDNAITTHITDIINQPDSTDEDYKHLVSFMEKLYTNPSKESIEHLFKYVNDHGMTITDEGDLVAYKFVRADYTSVHAGYGIVNGEIVQHGNLDNSIGNVLEMPRSKVDINRRQECSTGLHVGSHEYSQWFASQSGGAQAGHTLRVIVNPRDVVAVPHDHSNAKIRVARYTVIGEGVDKIETPSLITKAEPEAPAEPEVEPEEAAEFSPEERAREQLEQLAADGRAAEAATAEVDPNSHEARVARMVIVIKSLPQGTNLKRYRNKNVTAKNRLPFDDALKQIEDEG